jgi:hypothetical protein
MKGEVEFLKARTIAMENKIAELETKVELYGNYIAELEAKIEILETQLENYATE